MVKKRATVFSLVALVVSMLLLPSVASAAGRQTWYLDDDLDVDPGWADRIMYQSPDGEPVNGEDALVPVPRLGGQVTWRADFPTEVDVSFGDGPWDGKIMILGDVEPDYENIIIQLGYVDGTGFQSQGQTALADGRVQPWGGFFEVDFDLVPGSLVVPEGSYLALRIVNNSADDIQVRTGQSHGWLKSPREDPGYPVPELPTVALLGVGLLLLGGYVALRKRTNRVTVA